MRKTLNHLVKKPDSLTVKVKLSRCPFCHARNHVRSYSARFQCSGCDTWYVPAEHKDGKMRIRKPKGKGSRPLTYGGPEKGVSKLVPQMFCPSEKFDQIASAIRDAIQGVP